jgi:hypothetical protein
MGPLIGLLVGAAIICPDDGCIGPGSGGCGCSDCCGI